MRIIIISPSLNTNLNISGISSVTQFIIENNDKFDYYHFLVGKMDEESRNIFWFLRTLAIYFRWIHLMLFFRDTIIHFNLSISKRSLLRDFPLIVLARLFRKHMLIHVHGGELLTETEIPSFLKRLLKIILRDVNPKIVLSPFEKSIMNQRYECENVFVLPNCINLREAKEFKRTSSPEGQVKILFLGRISLEKGIEDAYQALEYLVRSAVDFHFILAGTGSEEELYTVKFKDLLGKRFKFKGIVSGERKTELLKSCDIFLLPSLFEGLPMTLLECMSFGMVPIATQVGSIGYVVENDVNGILVNTNSPVEISTAVKRLAEDTKFRNTLSMNARRYIFKHYDPAVYISELNKIYQGL